MMQRTRIIHMWAFLLLLFLGADAFTTSPDTFLHTKTSFSTRSIHHRCTQNLNTQINSRRNTKLSAIDPSLISISTLMCYEEPLQSAPIEQQSPETTLAVFIIGLIPFIWATIEFWRRIAVGASFGTGSDSVVIPRPDEVITIGEDGNPESSRGRRTLDKGALTVAYVLFAVAAGSVGIAVASVIMGPRPDL
jgi:hypothetical protein